MRLKDEFEELSLQFKGASRKRRASTGSSCGSIKSKGSLIYSKAKKRRSGRRKELEEENKRLKKENEELRLKNKRSKELEEENKRLKKEVEELRLKNERTSDSDESTASGVSIKSDDSKDELIDFKGQLSPRYRKEAEEQMERNGDQSAELHLQIKRTRKKLEKVMERSDFSSSSEEEEEEEDVAADDDDWDLFTNHSYDNGIHF